MSILDKAKRGLINLKISQSKIFWMNITYYLFISYSFFLYLKIGKRITYKKNFRHEQESNSSNLPGILSVKDLI